MLYYILYVSYSFSIFLSKCKKMEPLVELLVVFVFRFSKFSPPSTSVTLIAPPSCFPLSPPLSDVRSLACEAASHYTMERSGANPRKTPRVNHFIYCYLSIDVHLS